jgi:hypothetical protein
MKNEIIKNIESKKTRSAWGSGVKEIALDLLDGLDGEPTLENLLNGASNWHEYSYGGCYYIYDSDIAETLCTLSELKRTDNGRLQPNANETWLDVQARALSQAYTLIKRSSLGRA